jgi:hypothetical protein
VDVREGKWDVQWAVALWRRAKSVMAERVGFDMVGGGEESFSGWSAVENAG